REVDRNLRAADSSVAGLVGEAQLLDERLPSACVARGEPAPYRFRLGEEAVDEALELDLLRHWPARSRWSACAAAAAAAHAPRCARTGRSAASPRSAAASCPSPAAR